MPGRNDAAYGRRPTAYRRIIRRLSRTLPIERVPFLRGQVIALACVIAATLLRFALDPLILDAPYVTYFPAVLIASGWGGTRAGLTALGLSWVVSFTFWLDPVGSLSFDSDAMWTAAAFAVLGGASLVVAAMMRDLVLALRRSEERAQLLTSEMEHRIDNLLATTTALARQTARSAGSLEEHVDLFEARITALGHARKLAVAAPSGKAEMRGLVKGVLAPFEAGRFDISGPAAHVPEGLTTMLALALHELATNALKYGALSQPAGRVRVRWWRCDGIIEFDWTETGGPRVGEPTRSGFGTRMIRSALASHGAETKLCFVPEGLRCRISFPETPGIFYKRDAGSAIAGAVRPLSAEGSLS